jgi:hypothetical protein
MQRDSPPSVAYARETLGEIAICLHHVVVHEEFLPQKVPFAGLSITLMK